MARTLVVSRNFNADADGAFPAGFTDLNSFNGVVAVANVSGTAGLFRNNYGNPADARDTGTFTANQYAKITVSGFTGSNANDQVGVCLRLGTATVGGAGVNGYRIKVTDGGVGARTIRAYSVVNGAETQIGTTATLALADGDTVAAEIIDTSLTVYHNDAPVAGLTSVATTTHATGNPGIMASLGNNGTIRGDNYEAGNVTAGGGSSELSGNATLDGSTADGGMSGASSLSGGATMGDVSAGGGIQGGSTLTGGADLGGVSAGGGLDAPNSLSGGATLDGPTAAGGASGGSTITGDAALDGPAAGGGMSSGATGTLTSSDLKFNNGAVHSNAPFEAFISVPSTGALVLRKTGLTSTTSGTAPKCSFADAALTPGTQYRVTWRRTDTGAEGTEILTAT